MLSSEQHWLSPTLFLSLDLNSVFSLALSASLAIYYFSLALAPDHPLSLSSVSASTFALAYLAFLVFSSLSLISASSLSLASAYALSLFALSDSALALILTEASAAAL